jgi:hypothetical protein
VESSKKWFKFDHGRSKLYRSFFIRALNVSSLLRKYVNLLQVLEGSAPRENVIQNFHN